MRKTEIATALKLLATAGLSAGYLAVAFLAAHPRVDAEYEAHFVNRTADCWVSRALRTGSVTQPVTVELGSTGYPEACRYLRLGWFELENWGVWTSGTKATLELPRRSDARAIELTVRAAPLPNPIIHARFALNGQVVEEEVQPGTTKTVILLLPAEGEPYDPDAQLTFQDYAIVPNLPFRPNRFPKDEMRRVGLGLTTIRYLPLQSATRPSDHKAVQNGQMIQH